MLTWDSFRTSFYEMADKAIDEDSKSLRIVRLQATRQPDRDSCRRERIRVSFQTKLSPYCSILSAFRAVHVEATNTFASNILSPFERGLFLDFLLFSLDLAEQISQRYRIEEIDEGDFLYTPLEKAYNRRDFLWWRIEPVRSEYQKRGTYASLKVYRADIPYLEFYHCKNRNFPWQRHAQTTGNRKYPFHILGQRFESTSMLSGAASAYVELLDWYHREKYWGISLSAELSSYAPDVNREKIDYSKQESLWKETCNNSGMLKRLMEIPYPAYRMSFIQAMLRWYFARETQFERRNPIRNVPILDLIETVCILPPMKYTPEHDSPSPLPEEITIANLDKLIEAAFLLSVLSCMEDYVNTESLSIEQIKTTLECGDFWNKYMAAIYQLICEELYECYADSPLDDFKKRIPLILMPSSNTHATWLLDTLGQNGRINHARVKAYSEVQSICYTLGSITEEYITPPNFTPK